MTRRPAWRVAFLIAGLVWVLAPESMFGQGGERGRRNRDREWGPAAEAEGINTAGFSEGCPIETADGLSLMIASTRPGGFGDLDIWAADRETTDSEWGEPRNLGMPVNSPAADFCPTPVNGRYLFFVSNQGECGGFGDIYVSRHSPAGGWSQPVLLRCASDGGPNTAGGERSPSVVETSRGTYLFYSSDVTGDSDIYMSRLGRDGFGPGRPVRRLNTEYNDFMPNVRARERGGFEIVFNSDRPGGFGGQDVYYSRLESSRVDRGNWARPWNLGPNVNTGGGETRATLSADGERLNFGRDGDIYTSKRRRGDR